MPTQYKKNPNEDTAYFDGHKVNLIAVPAGTLQLPIHPTSDSGYIVDNNGKKHRVLMATFISGTVDYKSSPTADSAYVTINGQKVKVRLAVKENGTLTLSDKPNVDKGYVVGDDSEKHRVTLINTPTGTLELPNNETDDSAYVIDGNGNKIKVRMFALLSGGYVEVTVKGVSPLSLPDAVAGSLSYVKAFGKTEQRNLPDGYTQLEYIESTGTQYIDTEYPVKDTVSVKIQFMRLNDSNADSLFGYRFVSSGIAVGNMRFVFVYADGKVGLRTGASADNSTKKILTNQKYTAEYTLGEVYVDGSLWVSSSNSYSTSDFGNGYIFNTNATGYYSSDINKFVGRIYAFEEKDNGVLVRNLIPARRNSDNVVGMYDLVSGQFLTNQGTGTFTAGAGAVPTPDYPMDIISNNGVLRIYPDIHDTSTDTLGSYLNTNNAVVTSAGFGYTDYISVVPGNAYDFGVRGTSEKYVLAYDENKNYLGYTNDPGTTFTYTPASGVAYIRSNFERSYQNFAIRQQGIYTDGTVETITDSANHTATVATLLGVGDYHDTQNINTGAITRKVGIKVLDGTEGWAASSASSNLFYSADAITNADTSNNYKPISTHFNGVLGSTGYAAMQAGDFKHGSGTSTFYFKIPNITTADECIQWLKTQYANGTPVIVIYPLATSTTESVTGQTLQVTDGDNIVEITQASLNNLELEAQYQAAVSLTIQEVQDANLDPNVEVTIN